MQYYEDKIGVARTANHYNFGGIATELVTLNRGHEWRTLEGLNGAAKATYSDTTCRIDCSEPSLSMCRHVLHTHG